MTPAKRIMDLACAIGLVIGLAPLWLGIALWILLREGRPVLYRSERMRSVDRGFLLWKFRTMTDDPGDRGVSGGDKVARITPTGRVLRRYRLDEIPQLWNILRGDLSFVGPRPPLRRYVEMFPDLYARVLRSRPGITGLATMAFHRREEALLARCRTADETEAVYVRRCVPTKARIDLLYQRNRNVCYDFRIMLASLIRRIGLH